MLKNIFINFVLNVVFVILVSGAKAGSVTILVNDPERKPLIGATIHLTNIEDSVRVSSITNQSGNAVFDPLTEGLYQLRITYVGFESIEKKIRVDNRPIELFFMLREDAIALGEVTVSAARPHIRQEDDKMIIDPEPLAAISTNTLEILESTPGLFVDPDGGVYLSSATPATILINGREQKMSNQDINTVLRSLPPGSVQQIEVIRTPSARFQASSSGGIINIVLKRGFRLGRFGSATAGLNQGFYGNQFAGFTLNNGGAQTSTYINMNISSNRTLEELNSSRFLQNDNTLSQDARTRRESFQGFVGYGISYDWNERLNVNYDGRVNGSLPASSSLNVNSFGEQLSVSQSRNYVDNDSRFLNLQQDFGLNLKIDSAGSEWDTKLSYTLTANNSFQDYRNMGMGNQALTLSGDGENIQRGHFVQFRSDLTYSLPWSVNLETGVSTTYQDYNSDASFNLTMNGSTMDDPRRTNAFNYQENISAVYLQASRNLGWNVLLKTGVRMEHTLMKGNQTIPADTSFVVDRADWFPYLYLSRPVFALGEIDLRAFLIYRRSITRPGYQSLNPFVNYIDEFLFELGNPALKPQFSDNIEANISFNEWPVFAVGRNYTRDIFSNVVYRDPLNEQIILRTYDNLGQSRETYFRGIAGIPPGGRYFFGVGAQYNYNEYDGFYDGEPFSFNRGSWRFFTFHMLRLGPETRLTLSGFMMTRGQMNFYELNTFGMLNLGLNQTFLNKRLTVTLNARDLLRTMVTEFELNQGGIQTWGSRYADNQRFGVNIRYTFGMPSRQQDRQQNMFRFEDEQEF